MRSITAALIEDLCPEGDKAIIAAIVPELAGELPAAGLDTPLRVSHFLGQAVYETDYLRRLVEDTDYEAERIAKVFPRLRARAEELAHRPAALANAAYAHVNGNGDEASEDGFRFRGRGLLDITGRGWYARLGTLLKRDLLGEWIGEGPDWAASPQGAVATAIAFWRFRRINDLADADDMVRVTRLVQGGKLGLYDRTVIQQHAFRLLTA